MKFITYSFKLKDWLNNTLDDNVMDKYQEFLDKLYQYEESSNTLYDMKIYYKGVFDCLEKYEPILHSEGDTIEHEFMYRLPLECKDHAFNYFLKAELTAKPVYYEIGRVDSIYIEFTIEEEENNE